MTVRGGKPGWYVKNDLGQSIQNAQEAGINQNRARRDLQKWADIPANEVRAIVDATDWGSDIPANRIQTVVEAIDGQSNGEDSGTVPLSQSPSTDASPRPSRPRRLGVDDISYLSDREFARVLGLTLEQFDGNTVRPPATETIEVDLFWNRAQIALGIRTVTATKGEVGENHVTPLLEGNTTSDVTRGPSYLAVVTNGTFSDQAEQIAENNDIGLFDGGHLEQWFRRVLIPFDAVGTVLEEGEGHDGPLDELITFPTPPEPRCGINPLELERVSEMQTETTDERVGITREELLEQLRSLHDRLDRLPETGDLQNISGIHQNDYVGNFGSWDEALKAAGIDKEQVLLDDIERVAEKVGGVPSVVDMDEHGTYSADYYQSCFGSWSTALEQSVVRESYDSESTDSSREEMIETITQLYERLEHVPKTTELAEECEYSPNDFYSEFGSWDEALQAAGIDQQQDMLDEIERVAEKLCRVPNSTDMSDYGAYPGSRYSTYFDSWSVALERSGVEEKREEKLLERLRSIRDDLGRLPKPTDLHDVPSTSQHDYIQKFGSWDEALEVAGIDKEQYLIDDLKKVAAEIDSELGTTAVNRFGEYSASMHQRYFGSWDAALEAADLLSVDTARGQRQETEDQYSGAVTLDPATSIDVIEDMIDCVGRISIRAAKKAGYNTLGELYDAKPEEITKYRGVGQTRALKLIQFATQNISRDGTPSGQSSDHRQNGNQSSLSSQGANSSQIESSALDTSWETIPTNERIDNQFLIQVTDVNQQVGNRKTARLDVRDQNGRKFGMNIWSKHNIDQKWSERGWYAIKNTRGKVWESDDGTTRKQLSSTKDVRIVELGPDFDPNVASAEDTLETVSEPEKSSTTTDESVSQSPPDSTTSSRDTAATTDHEESSEDDDPEVNNDGVLDDIMSDFDEI